MAVSKRLRYEILRRDNHACRYCGRAAPNVELAVDHVVPTALGGSDEPDNLITACVDCNSGKSASPPDATLVADVEHDALRWAAAMKRAAELQAQQVTYEDDFVRSFDEMWCGWTNKGDPLPRPDGWSGSIRSFMRAGVQLEEIRYAINTAMDNPRINNGTVFKYFCGIVWRLLRDRQEIAAQLLAAEDQGGE